jgi:hypothetical protein
MCIKEIFMRINIKNVGQHIIDIATPLQQSFQIFTVASFLLKLMSIRPLTID